jgi:hypothetical protein
LRKDASNHLCVFLKILRKAASSKWRFPKMDLWKPVFKPLKNALIAKGFGLPNLKPTSKRENCFQMKTISSCFPILQEWISFQKGNCFQSHLLIQKLLF